MLWSSQKNTSKDLFCRRRFILQVFCTNRWSATLTRMECHDDQTVVRLHDRCGFHQWRTIGRDNVEDVVVARRTVMSWPRHVLRHPTLVKHNSFVSMYPRSGSVHRAYSSRLYAISVVNSLTACTSLHLTLMFRECCDRNNVLPIWSKSLFYVGTYWASSSSISCLIHVDNGNVILALLVFHTSAGILK